MVKTLFIRLALTGALIPSMAMSFSFPEIGFCPLGGPPGWFNRMTGQHRQRYYALPPMFRPMYQQPAAVNGWQSPVWQQPPVYLPFNPAAY